MQENEIINKLYTYNEEAFKTIYEKYSKLVFRVIKELVEHEETAEDLTQETFF
ncbi:MAG: sigma factor [Bacilli bacterium]|nr:sigma factor [Bacilli bacterium]